MSKSKLFFIFSCMFLLMACGQSKKEKQLAEEAELDSIMNEVTDTLQLFEDVAPSTAVDELFDDFFFTFATDARFQNQRIRFPLRFIDEDEELKLTKDDWHRYNRFGSQEFYSVIYEREEDLLLQKDTAVHEVSVQWIYLQDGYVERYNFKRIPEGQWVLFNIVKQDVSETSIGEFVNFYSEFISDSIFQRTSLKSPVELYIPESDEAEATQSEISADEWFEMKSDMPFPKDVLVNIDYGQHNTDSSNKNLLMEGVSNGLFLNFKFEKSGVDWKLIKIEM